MLLDDLNIIFLKAIAKCRTQKKEARYTNELVGGCIQGDIREESCLCWSLSNLWGEECEERNKKAAWSVCDGWADGDGNEV